MKREKYRTKEYPRTTEIKSKTSNSLKGRHISPKTEFKIGHQKNKGERHPNWRGGITPINLRIRVSKEFKLWRKAIFERDNYTCVWCGKRGKLIHADHIKPFSLFPELRFALDNGRTLCFDCHKKTSTFAGRSRLREK
jgi:5-methylcytosine-specific restriction endonuclease McrA